MHHRVGLFIELDLQGSLIVIAVLHLSFVTGNNRRFDLNLPDIHIPYYHRGGITFRC